MWCHAHQLIKRLLCVAETACKCIRLNEVASRCNMIRLLDDGSFSHGHSFFMTAL